MQRCPVCGNKCTTQVGVKPDQVSEKHELIPFEIAQCVSGCRSMFTCYPTNWTHTAIYRGSDYHIDRQLYVGHVRYEDRFEHDFAIAEQRIKRMSEYVDAPHGQ